MSGRYRISNTRELEITFAELAEAFDKEWLDAQKRGLDEEAFVRECYVECGWDALAEIGEVTFDEWDF